MSAHDLKIHGFYIILILAACLAFQTVYDWSKIPNVAELISFAVGLVSLVLAGIAIVQNLVAGPSMSASISAINSSAISVTQATETLNQSAHILIDRVSKLESIPRGLDDIQQAVIRLSAGQAATEPSAATAKVELAQPHPVINIPTLGSTVGGQSCIYLLARSRHIQKPIDIAASLGHMDFAISYTTGYLLALRDVGAISFELVNGAMLNLSIPGDFNRAVVIAHTVESTEAYIVVCRQAIDTYISQLTATSVTAPAPLAPDSLEQT